MNPKLNRYFQTYLTEASDKIVQSHSKNFEGYVDGQLKFAGHKLPCFSWKENESQILMDLQIYRAIPLDSVKNLRQYTWQYTVGNPMSSSNIPFVWPTFGFR